MAPSRIRHLLALLTERLGLTLVAGLLAMAGCGGLFLYLADEVGEQAALTRNDRYVAEYFHTHADPGTVRAAEAITFFGDAATLAGLGVAFGIGLALAQRWLLLLGWAGALGGTAVLNPFLKGVFHRVRPHLEEPWASAPGWSFPSGHAMGSLVAYGFLAYALSRFIRPAARRLVWTAAVGVILLIGFSRVFLGVHFVSDVLAGYAAATVWLTFCILATRNYRRRQPPDEVPGGSRREPP